MGDVATGAIEVFGDTARYGVNRAFTPEVAAGDATGLFDHVSWHRY